MSKFRCWMIWPLLLLGPGVVFGWMAIAAALSKFVREWGVFAELWVDITWTMLPFAIWMWIACINNRSRTP